MTRNATLDYARLVASTGIIVFHVGAPGAAIGYAALPFFLMLLVFLAFPVAAGKSFGAYAATRTARLLWPWAIWSLIYAALKLAEIAATDVTLQSEFSAWMLLTGPSLHLWFLPYACVACIAIWPLARLSASLTEGARIICGMILAGVAVLIAWTSHDLVTTTPITQWLYALPAVALGSAFGFFGGTSRPALMAALTIGATAVLLRVMGWPDGAEQLIIAGVAFALCLGLPLHDHPVARRMVDLSLTLYVAHPMVISILLRATAIPDESAEMAVAAIAGTTFLALGLQRLQRSPVYK